MAGYSGTPLIKKLGIKEGTKIRLINPPLHYFELLGELPPDLEFTDDPKIRKDFIHYFANNFENLHKDLLLLKQEIKQNGTIWISWPKKSSGTVTNVTEDKIRELALANGLVDVKVCAVDETWSGLKLVIPTKNRK